MEQVKARRIGIGINGVCYGIALATRRWMLVVGNLGPVDPEPEADPQADPSLGWPTCSELVDALCRAHRSRDREPGDVVMSLGTDGVAEVWQHGQCLGMGESVEHALADAVFHVRNGVAPHDRASGGQLR